MDMKTAISSDVLFWLIFGLAMNNIFLGILFGIVIGVVMGTSAGDKRKKTKNILKKMMKKFKSNKYRNEGHSARLVFYNKKDSSKSRSFSWKSLSIWRPCAISQ